MFCGLLISTDLRDRVSKQVTIGRLIYVTYNPRLRCRSHGYMQGVASALRGTHPGTPPVYFHLKAMSPGGSKADSPKGRDQHYI
jgi:hypothetical protein